MEILKRKVQAEVVSNNGIFHASLIDRERLSMRWAEKKEQELPSIEQIEKAKKEKSFRELKEKMRKEIDDKDLVINFTKEETNLIKKVLNIRDC